MREIEFEDVRPGDVARSNGKEMKVVENGGGTIGLRLDFTDYGLDRFTANALGVSFWREERQLPTYPGAWVESVLHGGVCTAVLLDDSHYQWLTTDEDDPWKSDAELLEWLGPDWVEKTTPPVRWVLVDPAEIAVGDYVRAVDPGLVHEGRVSEIGRVILARMYIELAGLMTFASDVHTWFKLEGGESDE